MEHVTRTLRVYVGRPNGERLLIGDHPNVPLDLSHVEIRKRFGLQDHMTAFLEYPNGHKVSVVRGAD